MCALFPLTIKSRKSKKSVLPGTRGLAGLGCGGAGLNAQVGLGDGDPAVRRHRFGEPDIAADDRVVPDGDVAQDGGAGVDGDVVLKVGMAFGAFDDVAALVLGEAEGAEGDALVNLDLVAEHGGLADDHAGAMVDEEAVADGGAGVDVDAGDGVGVLAHDAGDQRHLGLVQQMGQALDGDRLEAGIGDDDLVLAFGGGVAVHGRLNVGLEDFPQLGKLFQEMQGGVGGQPAAAAGGAAGQGALVDEGALDLVGQGMEHPVEMLTDGELEAGAVHRIAAGIAGEEDFQEMVQDADDLLALRHVAAVEVVDAALVGIGGADLAGEGGGGLAGPRRGAVRRILAAAGRQGMFNFGGHDALLKSYCRNGQGRMCSGFSVRGSGKAVRHFPSEPGTLVTGQRKS